MVTDNKGDGKGCVCFARSFGECACDADWTPSEVYTLKSQLELAVKALREIADEHENHAPAERKMHQIAQTTLRDLGIK